MRSRRRVSPRARASSSPGSRAVDARASFASRRRDHRGRDRGGRAHGDDEEWMRGEASDAGEGARPRARSEGMLQKCYDVVVEGFNDTVKVPGFNASKKGSKAKSKIPMQLLINHVEAGVSERWREERCRIRCPRRWNWWRRRRCRIRSELRRILWICLRLSLACTRRRVRKWCTRFWWRWSRHRVHRRL